MPALRRALQALVLAGALVGAAAVPGPAQPVGDTPRTVEAEGVAAIADGDRARARDEALVDAYRRALEAAGVSVQSRTEVRNFQVLVDAVTASAAGYLRSLTVLGERSDGGVYRVRVRAVVADGDIAQDRHGLAVLIGLMDNPTVTVALGGPEPYAKLTETELAGRFAAAGYHVSQDAAVPSGTVTQLAAREDRRLGLLTSVRAMADILAVGTVDVESLGTVQMGSEALQSAEATLRVRVVVGATGQTLFAGVSQARGLHLTPGAAMRQASQNLADAAGDTLAWKVARGYSPLVDGSRSIQVIVMAKGFAQCSRLVTQVRQLREVEGRAYLRAYEAGVGVIDVQSIFPLRTFLPRLEALGLRVVAFQANRVVLESRE